jgi:hypothetical protein
VKEKEEEEEEEEEEEKKKKWHYLARILTGFTTRTYEAVMQTETQTESCLSQFSLTVGRRDDGKLYFPQSRLDLGAPS